MADGSEQKDEPGVAKIKSEYLLIDYKPVLNTDYVSTEVQKELEDEAAGNLDEDGKPLSKRAKIRGRNKNRPKTNKKIDPSKKLCPAVLREQNCTYGDKCKFSHDSRVFVAAEPDNIGTECYLFETYGKCPYGIACRFSKSHLTEDLKNVAKENLESYKSREVAMKNNLKKDLQISLWKRRYDFSKADKVLDILCPRANDQRKRKVKEFTKSNIKVLQQEGIEVDSSDTDAKVTVVSDAASTNPEPKSDNGTPASDKEQGSGAKISIEAFSVEFFGRESEEKALMKLRPQEKKKINFTDKLYLAPLTTVGNLPFRRICKGYGADVTCGEMAVCTNLLQGQQSEWALLKRHELEDLYGVQLCGGFPDSMTRCAQLITETMDVDFIDINCGCPIDLIFNRGEGSALMGRTSRFEQIVKGMTTVMEVPLTVKLRTGIYSDRNIAHTLIPQLRDWGVALTTLHGRSRVQRYTKTADWDYISECAAAAAPMPLFGNGDIMSYEEANLRRQQTGISGIMLGRGALIKPWVFTEIKEQRHWDISSTERFDMLKNFVNYGFDQWGSDTQGVENTRRFLLEWLSFLYRYIPVGLLERIPQQINERPPYYKGRNDLETLMASPSCEDWIKISEMLLGPVPEGFSFLPKHKANAYK